MFMVMINGAGQGVIHDQETAIQAWKYARIEHPNAHVTLLTRNGMPYVPPTPGRPTADRPTMSLRSPRNV